MKDTTARRLSSFHTFVYRTTRGWLGGRLARNDMLLLTTQGRSSGTPHTVPLLYLDGGETLVVIASWGGRDYHPHWYLNLLAEPRVTATVRGTVRPVTARTADPQERATWWPRIEATYAGYTGYQDRTAREIPVVLLEPRSQAGPLDR